MYQYYSLQDYPVLICINVQWETMIGASTGVGAAEAQWHFDPSQGQNLWTDRGGAIGNIELLLCRTQKKALVMVIWGTVYYCFTMFYPHDIFLDKNGSTSILEHEFWYSSHVGVFNFDP